MKKILFISNGHAEDLVADEIIRSLGPDYEAIKLPLVDTSLPSGGFSLRNLHFLAKDLGAGLLGSTFKHFKTLRKLRGQVDLTVAIGDIVPILAAKLVKAPIVFVGVNKSSYYKTFGSNYTPWEKTLLKKALKVFVRDEETLKDLPFAEYVGNPLMDLSPSPSGRGGQGVRAVGFLPGTRQDAKLNLEDFEKIMKELNGFEFIIGTREKFAEVLNRATIVIGLAGTGNEQAAGAGIPVIAFPGRGSQYNKKFAKAQKELLGDSLILINSNDAKVIAKEAKALLNNPEKMKKMGEIGQKRMGKTGAIEKIAQYVKEVL